MVGEMSVRGNVLVGKRPVGEVSFGEVSVGEVSGQETVLQSSKMSVELYECVKSVQR